MACSRGHVQAHKSTLEHTAGAHVTQARPSERGRAPRCQTCGACLLQTRPAGASAERPSAALTLAPRALPTCAPSTVGEPSERGMPSATGDRYQALTHMWSEEVRWAAGAASHTAVVEPRNGRGRGGGAGGAPITRPGMPHLELQRCLPHFLELGLGKLRAGTGLDGYRRRPFLPEVLASPRSTYGRLPRGETHVQHVGTQPCNADNISNSTTQSCNSIRVTSQQQGSRRSEGDS